MEKSHCLFDPLNLLLVTCVLDLILLLLPSRLWIQKSPNMYIVYLCGNISVWGTHLAWIHVIGAHHSPSSSRWFYISILVIFILLTVCAIQIKQLGPYMAPITGLAIVIMLMTYTSVSQTVGAAYILIILAAAGCLAWFLVSKIQDSSIPDKVFFVINIIVVGLLGATAARYVIDYAMYDYYSKGVCCMILDSESDTSGFWDWMGDMTDECPLKYKSDMQVALIFILLFRTGIELVDKHHTVLLLAKTPIPTIQHAIIPRVFVTSTTTTTTPWTSMLKKSRKKNSHDDCSPLHEADADSSCTEGDSDGSMSPSDAEPLL